MGSFPSSYSFLHILVCADYVTKWVEAIPCVANDAKTVVNFLQKNIFTRFGTPRVLISDGGGSIFAITYSKLCSKNITLGTKL